MRMRTRLLIAALAAVTTLAAATATAGADQLAVSEDDFRIIWDDLDVNAGLIQCDVTLLGSFHETTIDKITNSLIGHITSATPGSCGITGSLRFLTETLPWHLTYLSFDGALPDIDSFAVLINGWSALLSTDFFVDLDCLYTTTAVNPMANIFETSGGVINTLQADPDPRIPLTRRLAESTDNCPGTMTVSGTGDVTTPTGAEIDIILV